MFIADNEYNEAYNEDNNSCSHLLILFNSFEKFCEFLEFHLPDYIVNIVVIQIVYSSIIW